MPANCTRVPKAERLVIALLLILAAACTEKPLVEPQLGAGCASLVQQRVTRDDVFFDPYEVFHELASSDNERLFQECGVPTDPPTSTAPGVALFESLCTLGEYEYCYALASLVSTGYVSLGSASQLTRSDLVMLAELGASASCQSGSTEACTHHAIIVYWLIEGDNNASVLHTLSEGCLVGSPGACFYEVLVGLAVAPDAWNTARRDEALEQACLLGEPIACSFLDSGVPANPQSEFSLAAFGGAFSLLERLVAIECGEGRRGSCHTLAVLTSFTHPDRTNPAQLNAFRHACFLSEGYAFACLAAGKLLADQYESVGEANEAFRHGLGLAAVSCRDTGDFLDCAVLGEILFSGLGVPSQPEVGRALLEATCAHTLQVECDLLE